MLLRSGDIRYSCGEEEKINGCEVRSVSCEEEVDELMQSYSSVKDSLVLRLINAGENRERADKFISMPYFDMLIVVSAVFKNDYGYIYANAAKSAAAHWNMDTHEIIGRAYMNMSLRAAYSMQDICDVAGGIESAERRRSMYVVQEEAFGTGASVLLFNDILSQAADTLDSDLYILPSSVYEVIVMRASAGETYGGSSYMKNIVNDVNENILERDEILSSRVFFYSRGRDCLSDC